MLCDKDLEDGSLKLIPIPFSGLFHYSFVPSLLMSILPKIYDMVLILCFRLLNIVLNEIIKIKGTWKS